MRRSDPALFRLPLFGFVGSTDPPFGVSRSLWLGMREVSRNKDLRGSSAGTENLGPWFDPKLY
jgi:hypothetical protein